MAIIRRKGKSLPNLLLQFLSGKVGGLVIKEYKDKVVISNGPGPRRKKPSAKQEERQHRMSEAVYFARKINSNPVYKAAWKKYARSYSNVYQAAVSWYMKYGDTGIPPHEKTAAMAPAKTRQRKPAARRRSRHSS